MIRLFRYDNISEFDEKKECEKCWTNTNIRLSI